jgi:Zn-finger protein
VAASRLRELFDFSISAASSIDSIRIYLLMRSDKDKFKHFENKACEFYPCHIEGQNCLFCYCPLYWIPIDCGGKYRVSKEGIKDCSNCIKPHDSDGWEFVQNKLREAFKWIMDNRKSQ